LRSPTCIWRDDACCRPRDRCVPSPESGCQTGPTRPRQGRKRVPRTPRTTR
jgi:hypothetical protein